MTAPGEIPDETLHALVDQRLSARAEREVRLRLESDPRNAARVTAWQRQTEALNAAFAPIVSEPLPLSVLLKLRSMQPALRFDSVWLRRILVFGLGLACGLALGWAAHRGFGL